MRFTFLGTGTSTGVPALGCTCQVCLSQDPRNNRLRSSLLIQENDQSIVIDTGPEFRIQALRAGIRSLKGVLLTHAHADHIHGLDDVRPLTREHPLPVYGSRSTAEAIHRLFPYFFTPPTQGTTVPSLQIVPIEPGEIFTCGGIKIQALDIFHGNLRILGFRIGDLAYLTDCSFIPEITRTQLRGLKVLVLDCLRYRAHPTHFTVDQALKEAREIGAERTFFTHLSHDLDHESFASSLPATMSPAYDGLVIEL